MGNCNTTPPPPSPENTCTNQAAGLDTYQVPGFCTYAGPAGDNDRTAICSSFSAAEWAFLPDGPSGQDIDTRPGGCSYNDCHPGQELSDCCNGCCPFVGQRAVCTRIAYNADPSECCFADGIVNSAAGCVLGSGQDSVTCAHGFRDITSGVEVALPFGFGAASCHDLVSDYCLGTDTDDYNVWVSRWSTTSGPTGLAYANSCFYALGRNTFLDPNGVTWGQPGPDKTQYNTESDFVWGQQLIAGVFQRYQQEGFTIGATPGFAGYNDFQATLWNICTTAPGLCSEALERICIDQTPARLQNNYGLVTWCGCYMPASQYESYVDNFGVQKQCTPTCAQGGNILAVADDGVTPQPCTQNICVIDDVNIALNSVNVGGQVSFSQFCGACGNGGAPTSTGTASCQCFITSENLEVANEKIGGNIDLNQSCGPSAQCYLPDPQTGKQTQVPCSTPTGSDPFAAQEAAEAAARAAASRSRTITIIVILVVATIVILLLFFLGSRGNNTDKQILAQEEATLAMQGQVHPGAFSLRSTQLATAGIGSQSIYGVSSSGAGVDRGTPGYIPENKIGSDSIYSQSQLGGYSPTSRIGSQSAEDILQSTGLKWPTNIGSRSIYDR